MTFLLSDCNRTSVAPPVDIPSDSNNKTSRPDHVIFVWFENQDFDSVIANRNAPFIEGLISKGTLFTNSFAVTHPSYPNYVAFFSGSTLGITSDDCIDGKPYDEPNLWSVLQTVGATFAWYSEDLPFVGNSDCSDGLYLERHNPTTVFKNVPDSINKPFLKFNWQDTSKGNMEHLERVVCISPNISNDMHDGTVKDGDQWLKNNLSRIIEWSRNNNSVFVIICDESEKDEHNRIPVLAIGEHINENYKSDVRYDHYNWTKTICGYFEADGNWNDEMRSKSSIQSIYR